MTLTFYYAPMSTATLTDLVIEELGVPVKRVRLDLAKKETQTAEYKRLNPNAKVPLIVHDDVPIFESAAITMYLGELYGVQKNLYPAPGPRRGEAMKWIVWTNVTLGDSIYYWCRNTQEWLPADHRNAKAGEAAAKDMHGNLKILDDALQGRQFLLGADYTLADTHVNSLLDWVRHMKVDFSPYKNINAWSERCSQRPAYRKVMAGEG